MKYLSTALLLTLIAFCNLGLAAPFIPNQGKTLEDFIPQGWEVATDKGYIDIAPETGLGKPNIGVQHTALDNRGSEGIFALIGKPNAERRYDEFLLLILLKQGQQLRKLYAVQGFTDKLPKNAILPVAAETSYQVDPKSNQLTISFKTILDHNTADGSISYYFKYQRGHYTFIGYDQHEFYFVYRPRIEHSSHTTRYDLIKNTVYKYSTDNIELHACQDDESIPCPKAEESTQSLDPKTIPHWDLGHFTSFDPEIALKGFNPSVLK